MFSDSSIKRIKTYLTTHKESIAVAESVTSGFLQASLSTAEEARRFYQGGITVYNIGQKARHLNIDPIHAIECNCVSQKMAEDMANSICQRFSSDWGIGVTGYASPVPESENKQFAYFAISLKGKIMRSLKIDTVTPEPVTAQIFFANRILDELAIVLYEQPNKDGLVEN